jgi:hypothetical protein
VFALLSLSFQFFAASATSSVPFIHDNVQCIQVHLRQSNEDVLRANPGLRFMIQNNGRSPVQNGRRTVYQISLREVPQQIDWNVDPSRRLKVHARDTLTLARGDVGESEASSLCKNGFAERVEGLADAADADVVFMFKDGLGSVWRSRATGDWQRRTDDGVLILQQKSELVSIGILEGGLEVERAVGGSERHEGGV